MAGAYQRASKFFKNKKQVRVHEYILVWKKDK
jgi:hypothetical protein